MLEQGSVAPDFAAPDQDGKEVTLSAQKGQWTLLWWYPKAGTPG